MYSNLIFFLYYTKFLFQKESLQFHISNDFSISVFCSSLQRITNFQKYQIKDTVYVEQESRCREKFTYNLASNLFKFEGCENAYLSRIEGARRNAR